jgi:hypothetical protein
MHELDISEFGRLMTPGSSPCVSIYLSTTPGGIDSRGDQLRLKNAAKVAQTKLETSGLAATQIRALLKPANELLEDSAFWPNCQTGLALWLSPSDQYFFRSHLQFRESVTVGDSFRVRPLMLCVNRETASYVLALSQEHVRLLRVTANECEVVSVPALPSNLREALNEISVDRGAQCHSAGKSPKKKQAAVFHAQGAGHDTEKTDLSEYCRQIAKAVADYLGESRIPLVLACVEYLAPLYRAANDYPNLLPDVIEGNPDHLTNQELVELAWPTISSHAFRETANQLARFNDLRGTERASTDTAQIVRAAHDGHVDELFFDDSRDVWGRYEDDEGIVDVHDVATPADDELIELAVGETLRHRGHVHAIATAQLPSPMPMAAILRNVPLQNRP